MKIKILGTEYDLIMVDKNHDCCAKRQRSGEVDYQKKDIVIVDLDEDDKSVKEWCIKKVKRHEITHSFLYESGLEEYAYDEKLVEWLALQFPKILKVFEKLEIEKD